MSGAVLQISASRFVANRAAVAAHIAPAGLMLIVKDDAYGHGLDWVVGAAADVSWFGSHDIDTALRVRQLSAARIFAWASAEAAAVDEAVRAEIDLGVGSLPYLRLVIERAKTLGVRARVHLKIDTGLHRNGIRREQWAAALEIAREAERGGVLQLAGFWSHLAETSDADDDRSAAEFRSAVEAWAGDAPVLRHLTASAASWWRPELRGELCRVGAFCYGIRSAEGPPIPGVTPIAALRARVVALDDDDVVIGIGSHEGLPSTLAGAVRRAGVGTPVGRRELRRIEAHTSRVQGWPDAAIGETVTLFGPGESGESDATSLAESIGTVGEEIVVRLTKRVRREIVD